jgi:XTP/dITP diphosphohydrolase
MWTEKRLVLASGNPGKLQEFASLFEPIGTEVLGQGSLGIQSPEETGLTFVENALLKARHAASHSQCAALADDSGLVVPALGGAPGLYSARYAGDHASDHDNRSALLEALKHVDQASRVGYYICALALMRAPADPDPTIIVTRWWGQILDAPRGHGGFGYDPLFQPKGSNQTAAEMHAAEKNQHSHRGRAVQALMQSLETSP